MRRFRRYRRIFLISTTFYHARAGLLLLSNFTGAVCFCSIVSNDFSFLFARWFLAFSFIATILRNGFGSRPLLIIGYALLVFSVFGILLVAPAFAFGDLFLPVALLTFLISFRVFGGGLFLAAVFPPLSSWRVFLLLRTLRNFLALFGRLGSHVQCC